MLLEILWFWFARLPPCPDHESISKSRPTVGFSGSGGAGKTPSPTKTFAGSRRVPSAAKPLSAANDVGRSPLLEQDTHARKRSFLNWQGANDTATLHDLYSTTPGKVQQPEHPLTFTSLCRQGHDQASHLRLQHSPPPSQGHAQERTSCADQSPLPAQPFLPACTTPGEPAFGSALHHRAGAGGDCQARHHDRNVHRPKVTCAGNTPRQATHPSAPLSSFFKVHSICAQRWASAAAKRAQRAKRSAGSACWAARSVEAERRGSGLCFPITFLLLLLLRISLRIPQKHQVVPISQDER